MESQSEFEVLFHDSMSNIDMTPGSIVTATVIEIRNDYVVINAGLKSEGIIPKNVDQKKLDIFTSKIHGKIFCIRNGIPPTNL